MEIPLKTTLAFILIVGTIAPSFAVAQTVPDVQIQWDQFGAPLAVNMGPGDVEITGARINYRDDCDLVPVSLSDGKWRGLVDLATATKERLERTTLVLRPGEGAQFMIGTSPCALSALVRIDLRTGNGDLEFSAP